MSGSEHDLETSIVDWVIDVPECIPILQQYGIDYSCAGKSLEYACRQAGADPREVLGRLRQMADARDSGPRFA